jgi:hypothetical protein
MLRLMRDKDGPEASMSMEAAFGGKGAKLQRRAILLDILKAKNHRSADSSGVNYLSAGEEV